MEDPHSYDEPADPFEGETAEPPSARQVTEAIAEHLLRIHRESYGRAAERVVSDLIDDTLVVLLDGLELLPNEESSFATARRMRSPTCGASSRRRSSRPSAPRSSAQPAGE